MTTLSRLFARHDLLWEINGTDGDLQIIAEGGHSPHSERLTADEVTAVAVRFLRDLRDRPIPPALPDRSDRHDHA